MLDVDLRSRAHTGECQEVIEGLLGDVSRFPYVASGRGLGGHFHLACPVEKLPSLAATPVVSKYDGDVKLYVVEILSTKKQVVLPPSRHPETRQEYAWRDGIPDTLPQAPESLLRASVVKAHVSPSAERSCSGRGVEGRNNWLAFRCLYRR